MVVALANMIVLGILSYWKDRASYRSSEQQAIFRVDDSAALQHTFYTWKMRWLQVAECDRFRLRQLTRR